MSYFIISCINFRDRLSGLGSVERLRNLNLNESECSKIDVNNVKKYDNIIKDEVNKENGNIKRNPIHFNENNINDKKGEW